MTQTIKAKILFNQMVIITSQPIRTQTFKGSLAIINEK